MSITTNTYVNLDDLKSQSFGKFKKTGIEEQTLMLSTITKAGSLLDGILDFDYRQKLIEQGSVLYSAVLDYPKDKHYRKILTGLENIRHVIVECWSGEMEEIKQGIIETLNGQEVNITFFVIK